ncbi:hypothetical protein [Absidia glauca]|uniref:Uncharacterized protein n=1 Tax=Absidia glauca TaxID=4829 RepID=A0A168QJU3_ABSGL|nr:hypothetical protein [Absidia glauca]
MVKKETIKALLFAGSTATFGYIARQHMLQQLEGVGPHLYATCQAQPLIFTHNGPVDRILCILVIFFQRAMDDYMGLQVTRVLLGLFGTVQAIMAVEGSRNGYAWYHVVSWFMFWGMLANMFTIAVVTSLVWVPLYVLTSRFFVSRTISRDSDGMDDSAVPVMISPARSGAILLSLLLAFGVPSLLMTTSSVIERGSWLSLQVIALWQFCPILIQLTYTVLTWALTPLLRDDRVMPVAAGIRDTATVSTVETTSTSTSSSTTTRITKETDSVIVTDPMDDVNQQRQRVRMAQSKAGVEQLYLIMAVINALIYYGTFLQTQLDGVHLRESLILLATNTIPVAGLRAIEVAQFKSAYFLFLDLAVLTTTFSFWALYEDGLIVFVILLAGILSIGPGSAIAVYALYRENRIQDPNLLKLRAKKTS